MKLNIVGSLFGVTGYDIHTRNLFNALYQIMPQIKLDVPRPQGWELLCNDAEINALTNNFPIEDCITIAIMTPPFWKMALADNPKHFVGFLVWEGDVCPTYWLEYLTNNKVDMIFVPSEHTKQAILNTIKRYEKGKNELELTEKQLERIRDKIRIVPHGVDLNLFKPKNKSHDKFTFICNKGWRGGLEDRGGVGYVIKAFAEEFRKDEDVELNIKLNPAYINPDQINDEIKKLQLPEDRPQIKINCENINYKDMYKVYENGDLFICATRAEAFNIPGLEAMACGLPTLQTNYGGQLDYMNEGNSWKIEVEKMEKAKEVAYEEVQWAIPSFEDLKRKMRWCFENKEKVKEKGKQASKDVQEWTWHYSAKKALNYLNQLPF